MKSDSASDLAYEMKITANLLQNLDAPNTKLRCPTGQGGTLPTSKAQLVCTQAREPREMPVFRHAKVIILAGLMCARKTNFSLDTYPAWVQ
jgi:hypothetical protein